MLYLLHYILYTVQLHHFVVSVQRTGMVNLDPIFLLYTVYSYSMLLLLYRNGKDW